jgi:hypothetical protein
VLAGNRFLHQRQAALMAAADDDLRARFRHDGGQFHRGSVDKFKAKILVRRGHALWPMSLPGSGGATDSLYSISGDHRSTKFL